MCSVFTVFFLECFSQEVFGFRFDDIFTDTLNGFAAIDFCGVLFVCQGVGFRGRAASSL